MVRPAPRPKHLGSGATVAQLTLDQKVEGSNPSSPANNIVVDIARGTTYGWILGFVRCAQTPGYCVIRVSDVLSNADACRLTMWQLDWMPS